MTILMMAVIFSKQRPKQNLNLGLLTIHSHSFTSDVTFKLHTSASIHSREMMERFCFQIWHCITLY